MKINKVAFAVGLAVGLFLTLLTVHKTSNSNTIVLSTKNTIVFSSEVNGDSVSKTIVQAKLLDSQLGSLKHHLGLNKEPIYLFMNTPGGSIQSGLELIEALNGLGRPINTITLFAASMGFQLVQNLGDRLILQNGVLMSHRAAGQMEGSFGGQRPSQMDNRYNLWLSRLQEMDEQTVKRTNGKQTLESYQKAYANELWLTGKQAIEGGYADKTVTVKCDSSLDGTTAQHVNFYGFNITFDLDNCPLNTSPMNVRISSPHTDPISFTKEEEIRNKFLEQYSAKQHTVVPAQW